MTARAWRLLALAAPALVVPLVARSDSAISYSACCTLVAVWSVLGLVLLVRFGGALYDRRRSPTENRAIERIDILTASGTAMMWTGLVALVGSARTGWASLGVVGVLGVGTVTISALWTALVAGNRRWRRAEVTCSVLPEIATEGDPLREQIEIRSLVTPPGMRLFVTSHAQRHGVVARYVVDATAGELRLESELGPALRGEHHAPPLAMWFGDVIGLTRTEVVHRAPTSFTVVPRPAQLAGVDTLLDEGGDNQRATPTHTLPTEGTFRIRAYIPGDDARRIHWIRSLQSDQLIVRVPDEIPPAIPEIRLVLDNELFGAEGLTCSTPAEMLDVLVRVWLGIGKALAARGTRVTLVAAVRDGEMIVPRERIPRSPQDAARFGARVGWQRDVALDRMADARCANQIIVSARARRIAKTAVKWVIVPESAWTTPQPDLPIESATRHVYPSGAAENRNSRRLQERIRASTLRQDRAIFSQVVCWNDWTRFSGDHVAVPSHGRVALEVIL